MDVASLGEDFLPMFPLTPQLARAHREGWKSLVIHGRLFSSKNSYRSNDLATFLD